MRCRVNCYSSRWHCLSAGCGASGVVINGEAHDSDSGVSVSIRKFSVVVEESGPCLFDVKKKESKMPKGSGDFSIGSSVWPGTSKLLEEMGELQIELGRLQQTLGKLIATHGDPNHWSGDLRQKLVEELGDVLAAIEFFRTENMDAEKNEITERRLKKLALFRKWHEENNPRCSRCGCQVVDDAGTTAGPGAGFFVCLKCLGLE